MIENINQTTIIPEEYHGQRIDSVLATLFSEFSRSQLTNWIKEGKITRNGHVCKPKDKALAGDTLHMVVSFTPNDADFKSCQPEEIPLDIIFEDESIIIINKPSGLVVHPGAGNSNHTLVNALLHHVPSQAHLPRAGIIHRLDKETTGLLVIAKTLSTHTNLIRQMQARTIQRCYLTLVHGHVIGGDTIETGFGRNARNRLKMAVSGQGRQAITHYSVNKHYDDFTLLDVKLMTGRTHQIRVHMQYINHPVVGDPLYGRQMRLPEGSSDLLKTQLQQFKRQALHASILSLTHPETNEWLTFKAPLPDDFAQLLYALDDNLV
jgi:23S rRNA pseudouridine1911/1915/1917 synthase